MFEDKAKKVQKTMREGSNCCAAIAPMVRRFGFCFRKHDYVFKYSINFSIIFKSWLKNCTRISKEIQAHCLKITRKLWPAQSPDDRGPARLASYYKQALIEITAPVLFGRWMDCLRQRWLQRFFIFFFQRISKNFPFWKFTFVAKMYGFCSEFLKIPKK